VIRAGIRLCVILADQFTYDQQPLAGQIAESIRRCAPAHWTAQCVKRWLSDWLLLWRTALRSGSQFLAPISKQAGGLFLSEFERLRGQCIGNPIGEWDFFGDVFAGRGVYLVNLRKVSDWEAIRDSHQRGPQSLMNVGYFPADEPAHENIGAIPDRAGHRKDLSTLRVCPPATVNRSADDSFGERGHRACASFQNDSLCPHEGQGFSGCHGQALSDVQ
jgi:hypothetical protein